MKFILGTKERMTQVFDADGVLHPVTVLRVGPAVVTQVKTKEKDGYEAVQIASGAQKEHRVTKAERGHAGGAYKHMREFRPAPGRKDAMPTLEKGASIDASVFAAGDVVLVSAISKGKGFQGVVKRHGFRGGPASHGMKNTLRTPGSIGATGPQRVFKGTRMAGRMGGDRITVKNL
ncbi:MAG TPA: 50S ribosomal protein L3, partial [Candidatus Paceibacterota bacterium]|nr:50S ribosomal protein L3 [Candidatus Paceibacterota bacterium]